MKQMLTFGVAVFLLAFLCSCSIKYYTHTQPKLLENDALPKIDTAHPVAIKNVSPSVPGADDVLCEMGFTVIGSLYDFTESSIGIATNALQRKNITINDKSDRILALAIDKLICAGGFSYTGGVVLRVKAGDGLQKEYRCTEKSAISYKMTPCFELSMAQCVGQMLNDKDILGYLQR